MWHCRKVCQTLTTSTLLIKHVLMNIWNNMEYIMYMVVVPYLKKKRGSKSTISNTKLVKTTFSLQFLYTCIYIHSPSKYRKFFVQVEIISENVLWSPSWLGLPLRNICVTDDPLGYGPFVDVSWVFLSWLI